MKKISRFLVSFLITFMIMFAIVFFAKMLIDALVFSQRAINYTYIYLELVIVVISSLLLTLFYQINTINIVVQILVTFITIQMVIYGFGIITGWFSFENWLFALITVLFSVLGLVFVGFLILYLRKRQMKNLNNQLNSYKERDNHEKN
ncbi:MAG: DUF3021 family protein [Bacilli bacterium]|nr:DUF3021 family protein [Bacilli bacterium]